MSYRVWITPPPERDATAPYRDHYAVMLNNGAQLHLPLQPLGFSDYVALGNSRKFWYSDELSVPVRSVTSPGVSKRLYLDPMLVERLAGKRALIVDDVIDTGGSAAAAIELLQSAGAELIGLWCGVDRG